VSGSRHVGLLETPDTLTRSSRLNVTANEVHDLMAVEHVLDHLTRETSELCRDRLSHPDFVAVGQRLAVHGVTSPYRSILVGITTERQKPVDALKPTLAALGLADRCVLERFLLLHAASESSRDVPALRVPSAVKRAFCEEFRFFATANDNAFAKLAIRRARFAEMCRTATLQRFPAGQFDWEISSIARKELLHVQPRVLPQALAFVWRKMRGLGPIFFSHLNARRKNRSLLEDEANRSYWLMAKAMELQPDIKGFAACSWFRSPDTHRVSPHLAWLSRVFEENGGLVVQGGKTDPDCGVLYKSVTRKALYDAGRFTPTVGLVMWPRAAMIQWARSHSEYEAADQPNGNNPQWEFPV
jgi:hypothetical protein